MDSTIIIGFVSIGFLIVVQIVLFGYGYGRLKQKVDDLCRRHGDLQADVGKTKKEVTTIASKVAVLEDRARE